MTAPAAAGPPAAPRGRPPGRGASGGLLDPRQLLASLPGAVRKLHPRKMAGNPVMFVVEVGAVLTTLSSAQRPSVFAWVISAWLWLTVLFANLAEAIAEGRGKAQADTLQAAEFLPVGGVGVGELADAAQLSSLADETPEGRSVVVLAKQRHGLRARDEGELGHAGFVPFTAQTRMSGVDIHGRQIRKGAASAVIAWVTEHGGRPGEEADAVVDRVADAGGTPLVVAERTGTTARVLGVIELKDVVKKGMRERFGALRRMGIRTVMITGDNPRTAAAIAEESGVDGFLAEATPEDKMALIRREQAGGKLVAMTGDGTNDAPALAQADVGVAMNTGTSAAKEAGNMVDLDSDPTKLIEIVEIGKQLLITRGALTTFSIANDVAKYFAVIPAMFAVVYPGLERLNVMRLHSPTSAITSAIVFNALIIIALIPLALRGVRYRPSSAAALLSRNIRIYALGGLVLPFLGIKLIDLVVQFVPGLR
ncbi:potassium-transporting ATPase subunit KdpB [Streptomyces hygroscopicus]|uniref:potassium-transporting ATPase subunit KdpB n=1 Tax=Streptomyces hygroscopicus TaxID=1912 RepID=UPI000829AD76|nr:hypothetical protein Shyhy02_81350 [Streptomyces hygroscopicus subsp. hygroscopicus]